jgi:predicted dehydrogenase
MREVHVAIVGLGAFGQRYARALASMDGVAVRWAIDSNEERLKEAHTQLGIPRVSTALADACRDPEVAAVIVVTPEAAHREAVVAALTAGKDVLVEKPLATSDTDADAMIAAADASGKRLMVAMLLRFDYRYARLRERLRQIGRIRSIYAYRNFDRSLFEQYSRTHSFVENAIHDIDLILWYVQRPVAQVHGFCRNSLGRENPEVNWGVLEFDGGALATLQTSWLYPPQPHADLQWNAGIQVMGEHGVLEVRSDATGFVANTEETGLRLLDQTAWDDLYGEPRGAFGAMLRHTLAVWRGAVPYAGTTARQAAEAMRIANALVADAQNREVFL